jgi:hypothetical protein
MDLLEQRKSEVEAVVRSVKGVLSYTLFRNAEGGASVTVCEDKTAADKVAQTAAEWMRQHASHLPPTPPSVLEGSVIVGLP